MRLWKIAGGIVAGAGFLLTSVRACGGGIEVPMQDAHAAGRADAFIAQADDPAAVHYDPAAMVQLKGTQISFGAVGILPDIHFSGAGVNERMSLPTVLPTFDVVSDLGTDRWRLGFGAHTVFGINEDWGDQGPLRTIENKAKLAVIDFSPTVAYKIDEHWSVGAALDVYYGALQLERNAVLAAPPVPEGDFRLTGTDWAVGATPSIRWQIDDRNALAAYYRSPISFDFNGRARVIDPGVTPEIGPSRTHSTLDLPQSIALGYTTRLGDRLKLEGDVIWTDWHTTDQLLIHSANPVFNNQSLQAHWKSGFTFRLGGEYELTPQWAVRAGYAFSQNAVPGSTFTPFVPDSNYHLFAVGTGYTVGKWTFDAAYNLIYRERRHIQGGVYSPVVDGTWDNTMHVIMLTATVRL